MELPEWFVKFRKSVQWVGVPAPSLSDPPTQAELDALERWREWIYEKYLEPND